MSTQPREDRRHPMRDQIASEWRKLTTTRSVYAMVAGLVAIVTLGTIAVVTDSGPRALAAPLELQPFLHVSMTIVPLFALLLGIRSFTDEFRFGSIVPTLLVDPSRRRVLAAKIVAAAGGGVAMAVAAIVVSLAVGAPLVVHEGGHVAASAGGLAEVSGRVVGATVLWTTIGVGFGLAVRHQVAAVAGALVWMAAAEGILAGLVPNVARYFPGAAGLSVVGINPADVLPPALGAVVLAGYAAAATAIGAILMQRRDIA